MACKVRIGQKYVGHAELTAGRIQAYGNRDYVVYEGERYTFEQAHAKVQKLASLLYHSYGVRQGDRVAICARNLPEWIWAQWATQVSTVVCRSGPCFGGKMLALCLSTLRLTLLYPP
jgi:acyl-coenzyme A synthetase/AMP-(fatty) acid ligase